MDITIKANNAVITVCWNSQIILIFCKENQSPNETKIIFWCIKICKKFVKTNIKFIEKVKITIQLIPNTPK